jgi:hypothetical protein
MILNDGSSDDTRTVLELYAKMDARNSLLHNLNRKGLIAYWNKAALLGGELRGRDFLPGILIMIGLIDVGLKN